MPRYALTLGLVLTLLVAACIPGPTQGLPGAVAARELQRFRVTDANGAHIGHAEGLYVAGETGQLEFAVIRIVPRYYNYGKVAMAGFGIKHVPVPWRLFELDPDDHSLHMTDCEGLLAEAPTVRDLRTEPQWVHVVEQYWRHCPAR